MATVTVIFDSSFPIIFTGSRNKELQGELLDPRYDLVNHSPDGFEWGYSGSGPAQLALAILAEVLGDDREALMVYQFFKAEVIASIKENDWSMTSKDVWQWYRPIPV